MSYNLGEWAEEDDGSHVLLVMENEELIRCACTHDIVRSMWSWCVCGKGWDITGNEESSLEDAKGAVNLSLAALKPRK